MDFPKLKNHTFSPHTLYCFNSRVALVGGSGEGPHPCHMRNWWVSLWAMNLFLISLFFFLKVVQFSCSLFDEFFCHILIIGCFDQLFFSRKIEYYATWSNCEWSTFDRLYFSNLGWEPYYVIEMWSIGDQLCFV